MTGQPETNKPFALIIEDDDDAAAIFEEAMQVVGFETEVIQDGNLARERLVDLEPTLIILDLHLPHVSGTQILKQIRADARLAKTRVMLITADTMLAEGLRQQADLVLVKPISFGQLHALAMRLHPNPNPF